MVNIRFLEKALLVLIGDHAGQIIPDQRSLRRRWRDQNNFRQENGWCWNILYFKQIENMERQDQERKPNME